MTRGQRWLAGIGLGIVPWYVQSQEDWTSSTAGYLCKSSSEVREVRTYWRENPGEQPDALSCRVDYLKGGTAQTLWSSHHGRAYCDDKASELVAKLTAGGEFRCEQLRLGTEAH
jgi:hypothetical protein